MPEELEPTPVKIYYDPLSVARRTSQKVYLVNEHDKDALLSHMINTQESTRVIIITKTKRDADRLSTYLQAGEIKALAIHGNKSATECETTMESFNKDETNVLIMTDMILQSQTLTSINQIISYNIPSEVTHYYARLAVLEEKGEGIALVSEEEHHLMDAIESAMKVEILQEEPEGFSPTSKPEVQQRSKKDKTKKPRHKKSKTKKESKKKEEE